ncbi:HAD family phosphatase [Pseudoluteimonas lycopersici]|uniref:HAD family phosphatase n=1 Tax=Pseudoluteimonas lycopersici TaxID=1324796 RepID=A0A516V582_9GAMM|nr:HAD family phosphatase [Lysobacter lycopersici]QDQ73684.1 HAD family phosphatase [Lysobacter lycopersici]
MKRPACVLFDLDHTLVHYDHAVRVRTLAERCGVEPQRVLDALTLSGLERNSDLGLFDAEGHARELSRRLGVALSLDDCIAARTASMAPIEDCVAMAHAVARNAQVAILTNNGLMVRDHLHALCPTLSPLFDGRVFCSAEFGAGKPDPAIFLRSAERLGVSPGDILFIDDKAANAEAARHVGMDALHYAGPQALRVSLRERGLLENATEEIAHAS